jgi:Ca2+-binding RTX toxin-like protein
MKLKVSHFIDCSTKNRCYGIEGGSGKDNLSGREGNDMLVGGSSSDIINGGSGNDIFLCGEGIDSIADFNPGVDVKSLNFEVF